MDTLLTQTLISDVSTVTSSLSSTCVCNKPKFVCKKKSTSIGKLLSLSLAVWFFFNHQIGRRAFILDLVAPRPASSTETHQGATPEENAEGHYNCGADYLKKHMQTETPNNASLRSHERLPNMVSLRCYLRFAIKEERINHLGPFLPRKEQRSGYCGWNPVTTDV